MKLRLNFTGFLVALVGINVYYDCALVVQYLYDFSWRHDDDIHMDVNVDVNDVNVTNIVKLPTLPSDR